MIAVEGPFGTTIDVSAFDHWSSNGDVQGSDGKMYSGKAFANKFPNAKIYDNPEDFQKYIHGEEDPPSDKNHPTAKRDATQKSNAYKLQRIKTQNQNPNYPEYQATISTPQEPVNYQDLGLPTTSLAIGKSVVETVSVIDGGFALASLFKSPYVRTLTAGQMGEVIGWGTGQSSQAVEQTINLTKNLTTEQIGAWKVQGVTREFIEKQLVNYTRAIEKAGPKLNNTQLLPRKELMEKILQLWK